MTLLSIELYSALLDAGMRDQDAKGFAHALSDAKPMPVLLIPSLSLRDMFAAVALHALLGSDQRPLATQMAYTYADEMLKARSKKG